MHLLRSQHHHYPRHDGNPRPLPAFRQVTTRRPLVGRTSGGPPGASPRSPSGTARRPQGPALPCQPHPPARPRHTPLRSISRAVFSSPPHFWSAFLTAASGNPISHRFLTFSARPALRAKEGARRLRRERAARPCDGRNVGALTGMEGQDDSRAGVCLGPEQRGLEELGVVFQVLLRDDGVLRAGGGEGTRPASTELAAAWVLSSTEQGTRDAFSVCTAPAGPSALARPGEPVWTVALS